jgi:D-3-phosphoglycerate dehydrogenase / 2-oxoglutarate reductase
MNQYKIVISDYYYPNLDNEHKVFERLGEGLKIIDCTKIIPGGAKTPEQLVPYVKDADALIVQFAHITSDVIEHMENCKVIARYAIGVDTIDIEAATKKHIFVANVPDYCIPEVADTAIAHILNAMRKITLARDLLLNGTFTMDAIRPMKRLEESTLCLIGFGNIARNVAKKATPFFKRIVVFDPYFSGIKDYPDIKFLSLEEALAVADAISIHVPLNNSTRNLISKKEFDLMRDGVVIVNTARGGIIDEIALLEAIASGKVGYCGLDVLSTEDFKNSPLLKIPSVAITPHIGWNSEGSMVELQRKTAENVVATLLDGRPLYCVN